MVTKTKIEQVRKKIDKIDDQILELIQKRGVHAKEIGSLKSQLSAKSSFYKPEREAQILRRLIRKKILSRNHLFLIKYKMINHNKI